MEISFSDTSLGRTVYETRFNCQESIGYFNNILDVSLPSFLNPLCRRAARKSISKTTILLEDWYHLYTWSMKHTHTHTHREL